MTDKLLKQLDRLEEQYLSVWEDIGNLESPTDDKQGVDTVGAYFVNMAKERGWKCEAFEHAIVGNVLCITMNPESDKAPFCLSGHMDTVHEVGSFGTPAVRVDKANDRIYGPGVTDCKGGLVAAFYAMDALRLCGFTDRPIMLLLQSDEEGGGKYSKDATIQYICEKAKDAIGFLNLEPGDDRTVCVARKGIATFTLVVHGEEAHSSLCATNGANAILEAAHKIIELEKLKDEDGITCCCSVIQGGTRHNIVPGRCEFKANVRFATQEQLEAAKKYIEKIASTVYAKGCSCEVILPRVRPAMEQTEQNMHLLETLLPIWERAGLPIPTPVSRKGGSDAANVSAYGIPCLESLGTEGDMIHTTEEYGILSSLKKAATRIAVAAMNI